MDDPPDVATLVAGLVAESESARKYAVFKLQGLLAGPPPARIVLAGEPVLLAHYEAALEHLGISSRCPVETKTAEEVTLNGQLAVLRRPAPAG